MRIERRQRAIIVGNRITIPIAGLDSSAQLEALKRAFTWPNPDHAKWRALKLRSKPPPTEIRTWANDDGCITVPRGGLERVLEILGGDTTIDHNESQGVAELAGRIPRHSVELWPFQEQMVRHALAQQVCCLRAPPAAGKTTAALALASRINLPTLVIVWTGALLKQWVERCGAELNLHGDEVGIIQGSTRRIRPITIGMQQSLANCIDDYSHMFGVVIVDECFATGTPILMEDGSLRPIEDVWVGDRVAVGGRVIDTMKRTTASEVVSLNGSFCTGAHPVATHVGWKVASTISGEDVLWYDPLHEARVRSLRETVGNPVSKGPVQPSWVQDVRSGDREMPSVWEADCGQAKGFPCVDPMQHDRSVEQGADCARPESRRLCCQEQGTASTGDGCRDVEESTRPCILEGRCTVTEKAVPASGRTRGVSCSVSGLDRSREDHSVRWSPTRQWNARNSVGAKALQASEASGLRSRACGSDSNVTSVRISDALQTRSGPPWVSDCGGDRREQSHAVAARCRHEEDIIPRVSEVASAALPGAIGLRAGRARIGTSLHYVGTVHNLETERGVYVASGVLVHNCQRAAAETYTNVIDRSPALYRIGVSADERRADGKEFLIYDMFGDVAFEVEREELEDAGRIIDVEVRVVPTAFDLPWYRDLVARSRFGSKQKLAQAFNHVLHAMTNDPVRNEVIGLIAAEHVEAGQLVVALSHRREHCSVLSSEFDRVTGGRGGILLGGTGNAEEYDRAKAGLKSGAVRAAAATYQAFGTGMDIPGLEVGIFTTPIANSKKGRMQFDQYRGRFARSSEGKTSAVVYYVWDRALYGVKPLKNLASWCKSVTVRHHGEWVPVRTYLKEARGSDAQAQRHSPTDTSTGGLFFDPRATVSAATVATPVVRRLRSRTEIRR